MSARRAALPLIRRSAAVFTVGICGSGRRDAASTSSPNGTERPEAWPTLPSAAVSSEAGTPRRSDAAWISTVRAAAAPRRRRGAHCRMPKLAPVYISLTPARRNAGSGWPTRTVTASRAQPSSSATIWAWAVWVPWPISVVVVSSVTAPSGAMLMKALSAPLAPVPAMVGGGGVAGGDVAGAWACAASGTTRAALRRVRRSISCSLPLPDGSRRECADTCRSGRCSRPSPRRSARRWAAGCPAAVPPRS